MSQEPHTPHPLAQAMEWVARITAVAIEMVLPGVVGHYLDGRLGTQFLAPCGFAAGVAIGLWQLIRWSRSVPGRRGSDKNRQDPRT